MNFNKATKIQEQTIPVALGKKDIIATAQSGSGKTAAFLLPILDELINSQAKVLRTLILVPTRELATQIHKACEDFAKYSDIKSTTVFGGVSKKEQSLKIARGVNIIIATTGRLVEHIEEKNIDLSSVKSVVIDEVDTMLHMGFLEDIEKILPNVSPNRQIMMFSATLNQNVKKLAKEFLHKPTVIQVDSQRSSVDVIEQKAYEVDLDKKAELLSYLIGSKNYSQVLVFVNTKLQADTLVEHFELDGLKASCIHGDIRQTARAKALRKFKSGDIRVLVATDIAARGIDIQQLPVVVNYELPQSIEDYTHRIGRTGRAGNKGLAITLLCVAEYKMFKEIQKELILDIKTEICEGFEPTEKKPRTYKRQNKKLSEKKSFHSPKAKKKKTNKKRKTTKRDTNRSFRK